MPREAEKLRATDQMLPLSSISAAMLNLAAAL
jgi:hypothetical protein